MTTLVERPDLSQRTALSKSEVNTRYFCTVQSFYQRTMPRPWVVNPDMVFGSAVDAGVEQILTSVRAGMSPDYQRVQAAATEVILRDEQPVDLDEVMVALHAFERDVVPEFDWSFCALQVTLHADIPGIGEVSGHPDIRVGNRVLDVKTSKKAKSPEDLWAKPELPIYAALHEASEGERPTEVGYLVWVRTVKPRWQTITRLVDDALIARGLRELRKQANLRRQFDVVAAKGADPCDYLEGPRFPSKCLDCNWNDVCAIGRENVADLGPLEEVA